MSERSIDLSVEVPGTPEEVWEAIATGPGIGSWFVPARVEGREGGEVALDFGSFGSEQARVTAWDPPHRFVYEAGGERPLAYEWLVEARDGGSCVVRLVNSGFGDGADWDGEYDGMAEGWPIFLEVLRLHLTHFAGRPAARTLVPMAVLPGGNREAWARLCGRLGIAADLAAGDRFAGGDDAPALAGTVATRLETGRTTAYVVRLDEPGRGLGFVAAEGDGDEVAVSVWLYLHEPVDDAVAAAWGDLLAGEAASAARAGS